MKNNVQQTGQADISNLNTAAQQTHIHIDLITTFYSITPSELAVIEEGSSSIWKDITLAGVALGIPCCINAFIQYQKILSFNAEIFWNALIGGICTVIAIIFAFIWWKSRHTCTDLINEIKKRPKYNV